MRDSNEFIKKLTRGVRADARREATHKGRKKFKSELKRDTIATDQYDRRTEAAARENMRMYDKAVKRLGKKLATGESAMADTFQLLYKSNPRDRDLEEIDPAWLVNASVRDAVRSSDELRELRDAGTQGDELNAGLGASSMADFVEATFERLKNEQDAMDKLREKIREQTFIEVEIEEIEQEIDDLEAEDAAAEEEEDGDEQGGAGDGDGDGGAGEGDEEGGSGGGSDASGDGDDTGDSTSGGGEGDEGDGEGEPKDGGQPGKSSKPGKNATKIAKAKDQLNGKKAAHRDLQKEIDEAEKVLAKELAAKQPMVEQDAREALSKAVDEQKSQQELAAALTFGTEGTGQQKLSYEERMALGEKWRNNTRLRKLAALIGRFKAVAFAEQRIKTPEGTAKIVDVELGDNLMSALPNELAAFSHPRLKTDMLIRMSNNELLQYKTEGEAKVGLGSIIMLEDGSGSMSGERELFAKALGGGLAHISYDQNRAFHAIHFGSAHQMVEFPFPDRASFTPQRMIEFYETFFNGGTDFVRPLSRALEILQEQNRKAGNIKGDIVMITDGACTVPDPWLREFKAEQERLGFHVFGIRIQAYHYGYGGKDTLETICDGRVVDVKDLSGPDDVRSVFEGLHKPRELR